MYLSKGIIPEPRKFAIFWQSWTSGRPSEIIPEHSEGFVTLLAQSGKASECLGLHMTVLNRHILLLKQSHRPQTDPEFSHIVSCITPLYCWPIKNPVHFC